MHIAPVNTNSMNDQVLRANSEIKPKKYRAKKIAAKRDAMINLRAMKRIQSKSFILLICPKTNIKPNNNILSVILWSR